MVAEWLCTGFDIKQSSWSNASCSWARYCKLRSVSLISDINMATGWGEGGSPAYESLWGWQWLLYTWKPLVKIVIHLSSPCAGMGNSNMQTMHYSAHKNNMQASLQTWPPVIFVLNLVLSTKVHTRTTCRQACWKVYREITNLSVPKKIKKASK